MYVINPNTKVINIWEDNKINHKRLNSGKYGVELYTGEVQESDIDGLLYAKEFCPMKTDEQKEKEERERLNKLSLTAADVERAIYKAKGIDFNDIVNTIKDDFDSDIDVKELQIELKANNFYRGNPYINKIGMMLGFTTEQLDEFFETNNYTVLITDEDM